MKKHLFLLIVLSFSNVFSQSISGSLTGTFVEGISPVFNTITVSELQNTETTIFKAIYMILRHNIGKNTKYSDYLTNNLFLLTLVLITSRC